VPLQLLISVGVWIDYRSTDLTRFTPSAHLS
jgi:hypothetical protein